MAKSQLLSIDTVDDRREVWHLLHRLSPFARVNFVVWACRQVPTGPGKLPAPVVWGMEGKVAEARRCDRADQRLTNELYCDLLSLMNDFGADAMRLALELERRARAVR